MNVRRALAAKVLAALALCILTIWAFPTLWYRHRQSTASFAWFDEQNIIAGWTFEKIPVAKAAESTLVADALINGEFTSFSQQPVRVFGAKRLVEKPNEIGLFVHTPDRCWTQAGWKLEPTTPDVVPIDLHGVKTMFERRIFVAPGGHRELVYFGGLVGGEALPYRLDHNLSVAMRHQLDDARSAATGAAARATDATLWTRVWDSFINHKELFGPKQFFRISTTANRGTEAEADALLQNSIPLWLQPADFVRVLASFQKEETAK